jgi:VanZ family protein
MIGFALGAAVAATGILFLNLACRGVWLPSLMIAVMGLLFASHPRLSKASASGWLVALFGVVALGVWIKANGPETIKPFREIARLMPVLLGALALPILVVFLRRNATAQPREVIYFPVAFVFLLAAWAIVYFSGGKGGADPMVRFFADVFGISMEQARMATIAVRKTIHFCVYGTVAWTAYRIANPRFDLRSAVLFGLGIALTFAIFDEWSQSGTTERSGSAWDVGLDMLGAASFLGVSVLRYRRNPQPAGLPGRLPS